MADPTKILEYAALRRDQARQAVTAAKQRLVKAQNGIALSSSEVASATGALAELEKKATAIRQQLSGIETPADGAALLDALEQTIIRQRFELAKILRLQTELLKAQAEAALAQSELTAAGTRLSSAETELKQAVQSGKQREGRVKALDTLPLSKLNASADLALNSKPFTDAQERINADIPASLLARARERRVAEVARLASRSARRRAAEEALRAEVRKGSLAGQASEQWALLRGLETSARDFISTAKGRFDQAQATFRDVADPARSPLTAEQSKRINDAGLKAERETAATQEKALDAKLIEWQDKEEAVAALVLKAKAENKDPDKEQAVRDARQEALDALKAFTTADDAWRAEARTLTAARKEAAARQAALTRATEKAVNAKKNPATDPDVVQAKSDLAAAVQALKTAQDAYKLSGHGILHAWEAAVPDAVWRLFEEYEEAQGALVTLKNSDPTKLKTDLQKAEEDYIKAQLAADASANVQALLAAEQSERAALEESTLKAAPARLFSALRGDY
jgi:hypothetical protein